MLSSVEVGSERTPKEMVNKKRYILFDLRIFWMDRGKACYAAANYKGTSPDHKKAL